MVVANERSAPPAGVFIGRGVTGHEAIHLRPPSPDDAAATRTPGCAFGDTGLWICNSLFGVGRRLRVGCRTVFVAVAPRAGVQTRMKP